MARLRLCRCVGVEFGIPVNFFDAGLAVFRIQSCSNLLLLLGFVSNLKLFTMKIYINGNSIISMNQEKVVNYMIFN